MKKLFNFFIVAAICFSLSACKDNSDEVKTQSSQPTEHIQSDSTRLSIWESAKYKEDTDLGTGNKIVNLSIVAEDKTVKLTIHTDRENLRDALSEHELIRGKKTGDFFFVNAVDGMEVDYKSTNMFWAIYKDDKLTQSGADKIVLDENNNISFKLESAMAN